MFRLFECFVNKTYSSPETHQGLPCDEGHQFMFRLFECLVNKKVSSPERC